MSSEEILERLLKKAYEAYKYCFRKYCPKVAKALDRKEEIELDGIKFTCWQEVTVTQVAKLIQEYCPNTDIEVILDGNNSTLNIELTEKDEEIIMSKLKYMVV